MWGHILVRIINLFGLGLLCLSIIAWKRKMRIARKWKLFIGAMLLLLLVTSNYFSNVPVENLFYTFPTLEAAADYVGGKNVCGILEGRDSGFFVYVEHKSKTEIHEMLSPRTQDGYKLGNTSDKVGETIRGEKYFVDLHSNPSCSDRYITVWGTTVEQDISVCDDLGMEFQTFIVDSTFVEAEETYYTTFYSVALFEPGNTSVYTFTVDDGTEPVTIQLRVQDNGDLALIE